MEGRDPNPNKNNLNVENVGYLSNSPVFKLQPGLMQLLLVENDYVVAVYETQVTIYNAVTGDILQELCKIDKGNSP